MAKLHTQDEAASLHIHWTLCFNWHCLFVMFKYYRNRTNHTSHHCSCNNDDDERQTCKQPSQSIWTGMKNYFTAVQASVTRWKDHFSIFDLHIHENSVNTNHKNCQSRFKCGQILNKPSKICPRLLKLCQSGEISPNLVTLLGCEDESICNHYTNTTMLC